MTNEPTGFTILDQYRNVSSKLKKRFLRKPNETGASESFATLGQQCESQDLPQYAALNWMAVARCEGALGNNVAETSNLVRAGKQFFIAHKSNADIGCVSVPSDNLQAGLACFEHAASRYPEDSSIPIGLNLEIVELLDEIGQNKYSSIYLKNSIELSKDRPETHLNSLKLLGSHSISVGDYVSALHTYQEMSKQLASLPMSGYRRDLLLQCEINSVFLLLILKPSPQNISPDLAKCLEKYAWGDQNDLNLQACKMSETLFILMESIVTICQSVDTSSLVEIESDFWPFLTIEQKDLLRALVKSYC